MISECQLQVLEKFKTDLLVFIQGEMIQDQAHDMNHILGVVKSAKILCTKERANLEVVLPAAYLHDCLSFPNNHPERAKSSRLAADKAIAFLASIHYPSIYFDAIHYAITAHSFSANIKPETLEAQIIQDSDRLDALGAIGIARCLQVSASLGTKLYNTKDTFCIHKEPDDSRYTIDHFYVKLLKIVETMNTKSAKIEAEIRTQFMKEYLLQLKEEV